MNESFEAAKPQEETVPAVEQATPEAAAQLTPEEVDHFKETIGYRPPEGATPSPYLENLTPEQEAQLKEDLEKLADPDA